MKNKLLGLRSSQIALACLTLAAAVIMLLVIEPAWSQEQAQQASRAPAVKSQIFTTFFYTRLITNTVSVLVLVMFVYLPLYRKKDYFFMFLVLNFLVFIIMFLISKSSAFSGFGVGLGLLAFFSLLRLRTDTISMKDMTYLFIVLTLGLVNAGMTVPDFELYTLNVVIVGLAYLLDKDWLSKSIHMREMKLETLDNILPEDMEKLVDSLRSRTGLDIQKVKILSVDLVKKRARVQIFHYEKKNQ